MLSPDGRTLAFSAVDASGKTMLWVRSLDSLLHGPCRERKGRAFHSGRRTAGRIGFFADGKLKTIEASGGPALVCG